MRYPCKKCGRMYCRAIAALCRPCAKPPTRTRDLAEETVETLNHVTRICRDDGLKNAAAALHDLSNKWKAVVKEDRRPSGGAPAGGGAEGVSRG